MPTSSARVPGIPEFIRIASPEHYGPHRAIALTVVVGATGDVLAVSPVAGPREFYPRAVAIAQRWKFIPFTRDGAPVPVRLERIPVGIEGPELWLPEHRAFPDFGDRDSALISLRRSFLGEQLTLAIRGDGSVTFDGGDGMALEGRHCAIVARESLDALIAEVRKANFFSMRDTYQTKRTPIRLLVALDDEVKEVFASPGESEESPERLWYLVDAILASVHADRWIKGDRFTGPSLVAENWNFGRRDPANAWMLAGVARRGDLTAVRNLIDLGAPAMTRGVPGDFGLIYRAERRTALERAAERGAREIVLHLLSTRTVWGPEALGSAYVSALDHGDAELAAMLLSRGADPRASGRRGMNALMAAAASGLQESVSRILDSRLDVNVTDEVRLTALHWAAAPDYPVAVDSVRANRRRVIDLLVAAGARVDARGHAMWTPLIANWMGLEDVAAALIAHRADVNAQDEDGNTPLMTNKNARTVQMLLEAGADPYLRNKEGKNALDVARADIFAFDIVAVLERWMATHPAPRT